MAARTTPSALFYPSSASRQDLAMLAAGLVVEAAKGDVISFPQGGGQADRELAVPLLPGMDEVEVADAHLRLRALEREMEVTSPPVSVTRSTGDDVGVVVTLPRPSRVRRVILRVTFPDAVSTSATRYSIPVLDFHTRRAGDGVTEDKDNLRVVVRPVSPDGSPGPPIFIEPAFPPPKLYAPVMAGLRLAVVQDGSLQILFPPTAGTGWLVQLASADDPTKLDPIQFDAAVTRVSVNAALEGLQIVADAAGDQPIMLWSNPNALQPEAGEQEVSFTPAGQRLLSTRLAAAGADDVTLPVSLTFTSTAGGDLDIVSTVLAARYVLHPLGSGPVTVRLCGSWTPLALSAPPLLHPRSGRMSLTARYLGRELNGGSPPPPLQPPSSGVVASSARWAATAVGFEAPEGLEGGTDPVLLSAQVYVQVGEPSEVVVEVRRDAGGAPGPAVGTPLVKQLTPGPAGWVEFELSPGAAIAAGSRVWVVMRTNRGAAMWFGTGPGGGLVSADGGGTWAEADPGLGPVGGLLVQLFHARDPDPTMDVAVGLGSALAGTVRLTRTSPEADPQAPLPHRGEYRGGLELPSSVLSALAARTPPGSGDPRVDTTLLLFSRPVVDLVLADDVLTYDPYGARAEG
jgi:hypothetical protein